MSGLRDPFDSETWDGDPSPISPELLLRSWHDIVRAEEPWCAMPIDDRGGELRRVIDELLDPTGDLESPVRRRRIRTVATMHGTFRAAQRVPGATIDGDFAALRSALRRILVMQGTPRAIARDVVRVLLPDWRLARQVARMAYAERRGSIDESSSGR